VSEASKFKVGEKVRAIDRLLPDFGREGEIERIAPVFGSGPDRFMYTVRPEDGPAFRAGESQLEKCE
jgi:hypothetical protein